MNNAEIIKTNLESHVGLTYIGEEEAFDDAISAAKIKHIQKLRESIRGTFNKDVLYSTRFTHTEEFSKAANHKKKFGVYSFASFGTKEYREFWMEEGRRCLEGYQNPITGVWVTGYHYFFLNYK